MITRESRIGDLLKNPIGRDILGRLAQYAGIDLSVIDNPIVRAVKVKALPKFAPKEVTPALVDSLLELFNQSEGEKPLKPSHARTWWKEAIVYQIYPRSFCDSDGDGVGDIPGILQKLDYLAALGVNALWLSPIFDSPNDDNGYDVRDYKKILAEFGTMADVERLIEAAHARGIRLIMDLVLNHTSDEHAWFRASRDDPGGVYGDYYIWRKSDGVPPNNWNSFFSGSAWTHYPERDAWALHLFSKKQMDLNWDNPAVRRDVCDLVAFWREKGVDGFRLDVINYISKTSLEDGDTTIGGLLGFTGVERYFYGKNLHPYLRELRENGLKEAFAIGETPGTGPEMNKLLTAPARGELDTVFCFDHLDCPGKSRYDAYRYDLNHLKKCFLEYEGAYADVAWPSIFVENHDNPRMPSKIDPSNRYRVELAKLLAVATLTARGTPFLYQGQELGAANIAFADASELRDVESVNRYRALVEAGDADAFLHVAPGSRDHARTPMQWENGANGGFTAGTPWIRTGDTSLWNVADEERDASSPLIFFRRMIALRRAEPDALVYGAFEPVHEKKRDVFCYVRRGEGAAYYVEMNLSGRSVAIPARPGRTKLALSNYQGTADQLRPYEANVYRLE